MLVALAKPEFADQLISLQASAYVGAKSARANAFDELTKMQEKAEHAQKMAEQPIVPSPAVLAAEEAARQAGRAADRARREAETAAVALIDHRARQPRGWRWLLGKATGSNARHEAEDWRLDRTSTAASEKAKAADTQHKMVARRATVAAETHTKWEKDDRAHWSALAADGLRHSKAADKALSLLERWPRLGLMGPGGLLRIGERLLFRESGSDPVTDPAAILRPGGDSSPGLA